jgi:hypothetical protein
MRVQFTVSADEWNKLEELAKNEGYPDVPTYCRDISLNDRTYGVLWKKVVDKINKMDKDEEPFALRDLIPTPPANMGVKLYNNQKKLNIEFVKKDSLNTDTYRKL